MLKQVLEQAPGVITTGGGIVLDPENVSWIRSHGWVVALDASEEELVRRLATDQSRPLLRGGAQQWVRDLKRERQGVYDFADLFLDTTESSPEEIVVKIIQRWKEIAGGSGI